MSLNGSINQHFDNALENFSFNLQRFAHKSNTVYGGNFDGTYVNDTLKNGKNYNEVKISADAGNDYIDNEADRVTIYGGEGADTITNSGASVQVYGDAGNDTIINYNGVDTALIDGGAGDDYIFFNFTSQDTTIKGGTGNDTLFIDNTIGSDSPKMLYQYTDGNDLLYHFKGKLDLGGLTYSTRQDSFLFTTIDWGTGEKITLSCRKNILSTNKNFYSIRNRIVYII